MTNVEPAISSASPRSALKYMPQLDGLRALAVFTVWMEHWKITERRGFKSIEWGHLGVWLFFVLSGFLITDILLKARDDQDGAEHTTWDSARVFYIRRFLRILPAYYLTLFVTAACIADVRHLFIWHFTYTTDFFTALHPDQYPLGIHFWTLAVEEQFYLIWPWVILLTPRKWLVPVGIGAFVLGAGYRALFQGGFIPHGSITALLLPMIGHLHLFALGALLALSSGPSAQQVAMRTALCQVGLWVGLPMLIAMEFVYARHGTSRLPMMFSSVGAALFFTCVIAVAAVGFRGPIGALLQSPMLTFPGKISYGLYLIHPFIPRLLKAMHVPLPGSVYVRFVVFSIVTLLIATASWYLIERPLNALKHRFPYARPKATGAGAKVSDAGSLVHP